MAIEDVIINKTAQVKDLENKINAFKAEIDRLSVEVRNKRAELKSEADKTLSSLNTAIPKLRSEKEELEKYNTSLKSLIVENQNKATEANNNASAHYKNLERLLLDEYKTKHAELDSQIRKLNADRDLHTASVNAHKQTAVEHQSAVDRFNFLKSANDDYIKNSYEEIRKENGIIDFKKTQLREHEEILKIQEINIKERLEAVQEKERALMAVKEKCDSILLRINEADKILAKSQAKEDLIIKREEEMNEVSVRLLAERQKLDARSDKLSEEESKINERKENLKIAEEELAKRINGPR